MRKKIKILLVIVIIFLFLYCNNKTLNKTIVIENVTVFNGDTILNNINLEIKNGKFHFLDKKKKIDTDEHILINGSDITLIPPLVNSHVHVSLPKHLKEAQSFGIFNVIDMYNTDENIVVLKLYNDSILYSKLLSAGYAATVPGGHGTQYGTPVAVIDSNTNIEEFISDRVKNKVDFIKIIKEPLMNTLTDAQTSQLITSAHKSNLLTVAHISRLRDARVLTIQGIDGFAHIWIDSASTVSDIELIDSMGLFIIPTLSVIQPMVKQINNNEKFVMSFTEVLNEVNRVHKAGILILAGTDAPNFELNFGDDFFKELYLLSEAGLTNIEVLKTATTNPYKAFNLNFKGIKEGEPANFILVNGNPQNKIKDIENIHSIWKNGVNISNAKNGLKSLKKPLE